MTICFSNCYRLIVLRNRLCANVFYRCNVIIVRRIVVRVELFIIVYIIYILIFGMCTLFCSFSSFYIIDVIILTKISFVISMSYRFRLYIQSELSGAKLKDLSFRIIGYLAERIRY